MSAPLTLKVNPVICDGRGLCAELAPELIRRDDWGFPIIRPGVVPPELETDAREVVRICPKLALRLEAVAVTRDSFAPTAGSVEAAHDSAERSTP